MKKNGHLILLGTVFVATSLFAAGSPRERISLNDDWRFTKGDPEGANVDLSYAKVRAWLLPAANSFHSNAPAARPEGNLGDDVSFAQPGFNDSGWRKLNLPHDFGIEGPFMQELPGETGKLPWFGVAWYRKHFTLPPSDAGRRLTLEVDGAMAYAEVWLNGKIVGGWPYGYASWQVDLTPYARPGEENVLAIRLDNPPESSRWYPGGGLYRNVWLTKTASVHVGQWGTCVTTPQIANDAATVQLNVDVKNDSAGEADVSVVTTVYELEVDWRKTSRSVASLASGGVKLGAGSNQNVSATMKIANPRLWGVAKPNRYVAVTTIEQGDTVLDSVETTFGIRTIAFTTTNGFLLNGVRVPLNGVCDHHDLGALGSAINTRALERQLEILRDMGVNAIRTSHNPPAPELLDLCDRMGFVVMDEMFDCWRARKTRNDYHLIYDDWHEADARALIRRDRNHPCVILWSIGNEISEQANTNRFNLAQELAAIVHHEDPTRPVTAACNHEVAGFNGFQQIMDVFGYNYKPFVYGRFRQRNPGVPLFGSETASCISSRGEYFFPVTDDKSKGMADFQMSSYDLYAPRWATTPDTEFKGQDENSFCAGEFVWTGFDYIGEPTPYNSDLSNLNNYSDPADKARAEKELKEMGKIRTPSRSSYFGIVDLAGFKKDRFYIYQARWRPDLPMAHILPHWNWPDREGEITPVHVYTSGDEAELFLNGKSLGRKKKEPLQYRLRWDEVKYKPGKLEVVAYKNGKKWATDVVTTAANAAKLALSPDRDQIAADRQDLSFVTLTITDNKGVLVPRSKNLIHFSVAGPGEIIATDNGDATSFESFQSPDRKAYNGMALAIVRATGPGKITLTAKSDGLSVATTKLQAK